MFQREEAQTSGAPPVTLPQPDRTPQQQQQKQQPNIVTTAASS